MTLGILAPFRRLGLAKKLLTNLITQVPHLEPPITSVRLHVHIGNKGFTWLISAAICFYLGMGFVVTSVVEGYYQANVGVNPPHAYLLVLTV